MSNNVYVAKENNSSLFHVDRINGKLYECHLLLKINENDGFYVYVCDNKTHVWHPVRVIRTEYSYMAKKIFKRYVAKLHRMAYRLQDKTTILERYNSHATERGTYFRDEHADCTVVVLSVLAKISYSEAHAIAKSAGRKKGKGMKTTHLLQKAVKVGVIQNATELGRPHQTVATFCKKNPTGRFAVTVKGHVLAIIDGKCIDLSDNLTRRVRNAWKIE